MQRNERVGPALLRDISAAYETQRLENQREEDRRLQAARNANPKIGALLDARLSLFHEQAQHAFRYPEQAMQTAKTLQQKISEMQKELQTLLVASGFTADYLQPIYHCPQCKDTGKVGDPIQERCACFAEYQQRFVLAEPGHGLVESQTFESYQETVYPALSLASIDAAASRRPVSDTQRSYMARIRDVCFSYAELFPNTLQHNLLLLGNSGLGKTILMNCIGNKVRAKGIPVLKITAYQLTDRMRKMVFDHEPEGMSALMETPLLLLDDLGVEPLIPNLTIEMLFALLNERDLNGLHTVISSNLHPDELKNRYTERITSRLYDRHTTKLLPFMGKDVRLRSQS